MKFCKLQHTENRFFVFEHPVRVKSWAALLIEVMARLDGAVRVKFDFCELGMKSTDEKSIAPAKERTSILNNSPRVANRLLKAQCRKDHRHVTLFNGRPKACEIYPKEFCEEICRGIHDEILHKVSRAPKCPVLAALIHAVVKGEANPHEEEFSSYEELYHDKEFFDDISGHWLDKTRAIKARMLRCNYSKRWASTRTETVM